VVSIKKNKSMWYAFGMVLFGILAYTFFNSGFDTKTRIRVEYEQSSDIYYKVNYLNKDYAGTSNNKFVSSMIDNIDITYNYNNVISEYISGYYRYSVDSYLIAYEDDITNSLWKREYKISGEKSVVIDQNNVNNIKINDTFRIDFKKYRDEINQFINNYDIEISGYLHIRINILEFLNFNNLDNQYDDSKVIVINIPLTKDIFDINVININNKNSYYEFSNKVPMNIVFLVIGTFWLSLSLTFLIMVIKQFKVIYNKQTKYNKALKKILSKYDDCIVRIKRFYVNKKYNLIYVDSFSELMDVCNKTNKMISFKETKRNSEAMFVILDINDAWIYKLISDKM